MARAGTRLYALIFAVASVASVACMTDHDALEKMPNTGMGVGGTGGAVAGAPSQIPVSGSGGGTGVGGHPDDEAPGMSVLTLVNGVVDAPSIAVCWAKVASDGTVTPFGSALSSAPLGYGQSLVLHDITGADTASDILEPFLIAGDLELVSGLDCASAIDLARAEEAAVSPLPGAPVSVAEAGAAGAAGASELGAGGSSNAPVAPGEGGAGGAAPEVQARLRVRGLPAIPAGTLNGGRSYLLVASGCLGGTGYGAPNAESFCGAGYSEETPTVSAIFAALSRETAPDDVGTQVLHASLATGTISVTSHPPVTATDNTVSIVMNEVEGELAPRPADVDQTAFDYGSARGYHLEVAVQGAAVLSQSWSDILALGGIDALEDGSNYTLVLIGPSADTHAGAGAAFWNLPAITVVPSDPP